MCWFGGYLWPPKKSRVGNACRKRWSLAFQVWISGFGGLGFSIQGLGCSVQGSGFWVRGLGIEGVSCSDNFVIVMM